jgi:hypothetical protein
MSSMVNLEIPWINILSKMDLVEPTKKTDNDDDDDREKRLTPGALNGRRGRRNIAKYACSLA